MIELHDTTRVWSVWFVGFPGGDWMAVLLKQEAETLPAVIYRFRYDALPGEDGDERRWFRVEADPRVALADGADAVAAELVRATNGVAEKLSEQARAKAHRIDVNGDGLRAMELIAQQPWSRVVERPEAQA